MAALTAGQVDGMDKNECIIPSPGCYIIIL